MFNFASGIRNIIRSSLAPVVKGPTETHESNGLRQSDQEEEETSPTPETSHVGNL
jgi:hypothetical protein